VGPFFQVWKNGTELASQLLRIDHVVASGLALGQPGQTVGHQMASQGLMTVAESGTSVNKANAKEVVRAAHAEMRELIRKRTEIMQRIGSVKRTIMGLAEVFGDSILGDAYLDLKSRQKGGEQRGFTRTCRVILMESAHPLTAREICEELKKRIDQIEVRHKDLLASVTTVLNRLAEYGEAQPVTLENGRRAWRWIVEPGVSSKSEA
jgi:hypothetical protein